MADAHPGAESESPVVPSAVRTASCAPLQTRSPPMSAPCKVIVPVAVNPSSRYTSRPTRIPAPTSDWPILLAPNWARLQTNWPPVWAPSSHGRRPRSAPQEHVAADLEPVATRALPSPLVPARSAESPISCPLISANMRTTGPAAVTLSTTPARRQSSRRQSAHRRRRRARQVARRCRRISADVRASQGDCSRGREPVVEVAAADAHPRADLRLADLAGAQLLGAGRRTGRRYRPRAGPRRGRGQPRRSTSPPTFSRLATSAFHHR